MMSSLLAAIEGEIILAMKGKDEVKLATLRLLKSALKNARIEKRSDLIEADELKVLRREVKKRKESIENFQAGGRADLVAKETAELNCLESYLPKELADEEIRKIIEKIIKENNFSQKDFGQAMKLATAEFKGQIEGQRLAALVKAMLTS